MKELLQDMQTRRFWLKFMTKTFALLGTATVVVKGVVALLPERADWFGGGTVFVIVLICCTLLGLALSWPRPVQCEYASPQTKISIVKGDLFEQDGDIVVGIANSFDTEIPHIIEQKSLLGQTIARLYRNDWKRLDADLETALSTKPVIGTIEKPGKRNLYELGTVATVANGPRRIFFSAYSEMSGNNNASTNIEVVTKSLYMLWDEVGRRGNGQPVSIVPWGGGLSRISRVLPAQDSIRLIILTFMFASRHQKISDELTVVVPEPFFNSLDRLELQAFLNSLRSS